MDLVKTAVIGAGGFIGRHLWNCYRTRFPDCVGTTRAELDLTRPDVRSLRLRETGHQAVLIAAALPIVGFCERNPEASYAVNVAGTLELVRQLEGLPVVFLSSDYVFSGSGWHDETSGTDPSTEYGRQKVAVEEALPADALILRLSKAYGLQRGDGTLFDELAGCLSAGRAVLAAHDQRFCPVWIEDLVRAVVTVQSHGLTGRVNLGGPERISRFEAAQAVAASLGADPALVRKVSLHDLPGMENRPLDTSLCSTRLAELPLTFRSCRSAVEEIARQWKEGAPP